MEKRQFLSSAAGVLVGAAGMAFYDAKVKTVEQPPSQTILTVIGDINNTNRKKSDAVLDQMMHKLGMAFERAYAFSLFDLEKLPVTSIRPTMEYDAKVHELSGPRLVDVLHVVGLTKAEGASIRLRGIDGYSPEITLDLARKYDYILATRIDGQLLSIGGLGPLFAIYDADRIDDFSKKPLDQRFVACPWGLYCIEVKA